MDSDMKSWYRIRHLEKMLFKSHIDEPKSQSMRGIYYESRTLRRRRRRRDETSNLLAELKRCLLNSFWKRNLHENTLNGTYLAQVGVILVVWVKVES